MVIRTDTRAGERGFSLFELVVALAIAALILGIGAPSFTEFRRNARLTGIANDFLSAAELARTEAAKRQKKVSLCASTNAESLDRRCSAQQAFGGWIVFEDPTGGCVLSDGTQPIRTNAAIDPSDATAVSANADMSCLTYDGTGFTVEPGGPAQPHHIAVCDVRGVTPPTGITESPARGVSIDASGHVSITRDPAKISNWTGITCTATSG